MSKSVVVKTLCGSLRGTVQRSFEGYDYFSFKAIPYARPPIGHLRFRDPVPAEPWSGVKNATKYGPICVQTDFITRSIDGDEDCLYLNVYTKSIDPENALPVMIFIHGGGFIFGSGDDLFYGPDYLLRKDIVLVTFNYRLGVIGFLNFGHEAAPGNQGLKDQVMLLRWVKENIKYFGGDSNNVTIFGESAGGSSVHYLALSSLAKGLFHKAIIQSGVANNPWACSSSIEHAYKLCKSLGNDSTDPEELVEFLRTIDYKKLVEAHDSLRSYKDKLHCTVLFGPGVDDKSKEPFMPIHPLKAMEQGIHVPLIIGCTIHEGIMNLPGLKEYVLEDLNRNFDKYLNPVTLNLLQRIGITLNDLKYYYYGNEKVSLKNIKKYIEYCTDMNFLEGIHRVISLQVKKSSTPTYFYRFTYDKELSIMKSIVNTELSGSGHFDEIQYLFSMQIYDMLNIECIKRGTTGYRIMEQITEMWVNFAKYGNPTPVISDLLPIKWLPNTNKKTFCTLNINEKLQIENTISLDERLTQNKQLKNKL